MDRKPLDTQSKRWRGQRGVTLIETVLAAAILMIVVAGLLPLFTTSLVSNEVQGDVATRTTEYAQDKMEQLMRLSFTDGTTDTTVFPSNPAGCTGISPNICGLGGTMAANAIVGSLPPAAVVAKYVDYLDMNGNLLTSAAGAFYTRQWKISADATASLKTISVTVTSKPLGGNLAASPSTTVVCIKSSGL